MKKVISKVFFEHGIRFVFSTRSKVPWILKEGTQERFFESSDYVFTPGKDEIIRGASDPKACDGWVVTFGEMLYRVVDAVDRLATKEKGLKIGVINKVSVNLVDEEALQLIGNSKFVLVAESWNEKTGLGSRLGTMLLERHLTPKFKRMGSTREGCGESQQCTFIRDNGLTESVPDVIGGLTEQIPSVSSIPSLTQQRADTRLYYRFQGLDPQSIITEIQCVVPSCTGPS